VHLQLEIVDATLIMYFLKELLHICLKPKKQNYHQALELTTSIQDIPALVLLTIRVKGLTHILNGSYLVQYLVYMI